MTQGKSEIIAFKSEKRSSHGQGRNKNKQPGRTPGQPGERHLTDPIYAVTGLTPGRVGFVFMSPGKVLDLLETKDPLWVLRENIMVVSERHLWLETFAHWCLSMWTRRTRLYGRARV